MLQNLSNPDAVVSLLGGLEQTTYIASGAGFFVGVVLASLWGRRG